MIQENKIEISEENCLNKDQNLIHNSTEDLEEEIIGSKKFKYLKENDYSSKQDLVSETDKVTCADNLINNDINVIEEMKGKNEEFKTELEIQKPKYLLKKRNVRNDEKETKNEIKENVDSLECETNLIVNENEDCEIKETNTLCEKSQIIPELKNINIVDTPIEIISEHIQKENEIPQSESMD